MKSVALVTLFAFIIGLFIFFMFNKKNQKNTNNEEKIIDVEYEEIDKNKKDKFKK